MTSCVNKTKEGHYHLSSHVALTSFMSQVLGHWQNLLVPFSELQCNEYHPI